MASLSNTNTLMWSCAHPSHLWCPTPRDVLELLLCSHLVHLPPCLQVAQAMPTQGYPIRNGDTTEPASRDIWLWEVWPWVPPHKVHQAVQQENMEKNIFGRQGESQGNIRLGVAQKTLSRHVHHFFPQSWWGYITVVQSSIAQCSVKFLFYENVPR